MNLESQYVLEQEMFDSGKARYQRDVAAAQQAGRESDTSYGARLLSQYIGSVSEALDERRSVQKRGVRAKALKLTEGCESSTLALIALRTILNNISVYATATDSYMAIGTEVENDIRFTRFREAQPFEMKSLIESFEARNIKSYQLQCMIVRKRAAKYEEDWVKWTPAERAATGAFICDVVLQCTDLFEIRMVRKGMKTTNYIVATDSVMDWIYSHKEIMEILHPNHMPCLIQPKPWTDLHDGGYYSDFMQSRVAFIKFRTKDHAKLLKGHDFSVHMHGVNLMQNTAWNVNSQVLEVAQEVWKKNLGTGMPSTEPHEVPTNPLLGRHWDSMSEEEQCILKDWKRDAMLLHVTENERKGKIIQYARAMSTAQKYKEEEFYYVYNCDFRGRTYCATVGLSPQGSDFGKALIHFAERKELGEHGARHLQIHGANVYGEDKLPYSGRVEWVKHNEDAITKCASDPMSSESRSFWGDADKPYQFLAFCFEYTRYINEGRSRHFLSSLPIGADGTCNGLQHFSALLRDPVGARATNLVPADKPDDIYQRVADVVTGKLQDSNDLMAVQWLSIGITRKITKKPVMTLPYGSTLTACTQSVDDWLRENDKLTPWTSSNRYKAARYLSALIWESISEVVVAAREAMTWLKKCSTLCTKADYNLQWVSPSRFKVVYSKVKINVQPVKMSMQNKKVMVKVALPTDRLDIRKTGQGISPNYVHSLDSGHMILSIIRAHSMGCTSFAMIHDDYGTHAGDMHNLHIALRDEFVGIYKDRDLLKQFMQENTIGRTVSFPDQPVAGALDVSCVIDSEYFFG